MRTFTINGKAMTSRSEAHEELMRALDLPAIYGRNLDALWDCITSIDADVTLVDPAPMLNALGSYGCKLLQTLYEAAQYSTGFRFRIAE